MRKNTPTKKGFSPFKESKTFTDRPAAKRSKDESGDDNKKSGFKPAPEGPREKRNRIQPTLKTANGRTPFKPKPGDKDKDDSAFHGSPAKAGGKTTPSGFNRQKYFDTANERFANKQARKAEKKDDVRGEGRTFRKDDSRSEGRTFKKDDSRGEGRSFRKDDSRGEGRTFRKDDSRPARKDDSREERRSFRKDDNRGEGRTFRKDDSRPARKEDGREERRSFRKDDSRTERKPFGDKPARKGAPGKSTHSEREGEESRMGPGEMPLNKYIAHSGLCSRRKAVDYVKEGQVTVNGETITEPAFKVTAKDDVRINGRPMKIQKNLVYILLNKPKGYITTTDDPEGRRTVMELIQDATEEERVYPVGRLDRNTSGLLLLTNDGELAQKLAHPSNNIKKIYHVGLDKPLTKADFDKILAGVTLEDGLAGVDALGYVEPGDKAQVGIEIHSGKNRIVRRIFEHLEYQVEKLDRVTYAGLTKKNIPRGKWRFLSEKEVILLKHFK
jgi:23S rRNA pseudouridine2605 synthase